jgi:hypothetical protein
MTRPEHQNTRDLTFSRWVRNNLPDSSTGFSATDLDFILWNWSPTKERMMLVEVKTHGASLSTGQKMHMRRLDEWIRTGVMHDKAWHYMGMFVITFEGADFTDGHVWIQNIQSDTKHEVKEADLVALLSL